MFGCTFWSIEHESDWSTILKFSVISMFWHNFNTLTHVADAETNTHYVAQALWTYNILLGIAHWILSKYWQLFLQLLFHEKLRIFFFIKCFKASRLIMGTKYGFFMKKMLVANVVHIWIIVRGSKVLLVPKHPSFFICVLEFENMH